MIVNGTHYIQTDTWHDITTHVTIIHIKRDNPIGSTPATYTLHLTVQFICNRPANVTAPPTPSWAAEV